MIFARAPRYGAVKTRLAQARGAGTAWRAAREMTAATLDELASDARWETRLAVTPARYATEGRFWPRTVGRTAQRGADLGQRMAAALEQGSARGPTLVVGSDIPGVRRPHIARAFASLAGHDVVVGPAEDGGYWLIGVRQGLPPALCRGLFRTVRWSSPTALADTLNGLPSRLRVATAETLWDVDTPGDLDRWRALRERSGGTWRRGRAGRGSRAPCR